MASPNNPTTTYSLTKNIDEYKSDPAYKVYYEFFYKNSFMAYLLPMVFAFFIYLMLYVPVFRRASTRSRTKLLTIR